MQAVGKETMTQAEVDILVGAMGMDSEDRHPPESFSIEMKKKAVANYRQLQLAMRRADVLNLGRRPDDMADRLRNVHYYAHLNWLYNRGFASKRHFREFVEAEKKKKGMI